MSENKIEVTKEEKKSFALWSKKSSLKVDEIEQRFVNMVNEHPDWDRRRIKKILRGELSDEVGSLYSNATTFYGYLMGDSGMFDWLERMAEKAERIKGDEEHPERFDEAVESGILNEEGVPLDYRKKKFGAPNPFLGVPLSDMPSEFQRDLYAIVSSDPKFETVRLAKIELTGDIVKNLENIKLFRWYRFRVNIAKKKESGSNVIILRSATATKFNPFESEISPEEIVNKLDYRDIDIEEIGLEHKNRFENKPSTNYLSVLRGEAHNIMFEPRQGQRGMYRAFNLISEGEELADTSVRCNVTVNIPLVIKEAESIVAIGRLWNSKRTGKYGMEVRGYVPLGY